MTQHLTSLVERLETEMLPETRCAVNWIRLGGRENSG